MGVVSVEALCRYGLVMLGECHRSSPQLRLSFLPTDWVGLAPAPFYPELGGGWSTVCVWVCSELGKAVDAG
jgi:hypothetical protein